MRRLCYLVLGFGLGLAAFARGPAWLWILPAMALFLARDRRIRGLVLTGFAGGLGWFFLWSAFYLSPVKNLPPEPRAVTVLITDYEQDGSVRGKLRLQGRTYGCLLMEADPALEPGDRVRGTVVLSGTLETRLPGRGIYLRAQPRGTLLRQEGKGDWTCRAARLRKALSDRIDRLFPRDTAGFAKALLLGDIDSLDPDSSWNLSVSGIRHVVAVSGLHVSILWMLISLLTARRQKLTFPLGLLLLAGFCAVTGFTPSVVRAALMITVMMAAPFLGRQYDGLSALALAALLMMAGNPMVVTNVSFQMSVASVLGMLLLFKPIKFWLRVRLPELRGFPGKLWDLVCASAAVSLSALAAVTPLTAWHFGSVSLIAPVTNLLTIWAVIWIFWGIVLTLVFSWPLWSLACLTADLTALLIRYVLLLSGWLAKLPFAALYTENRLLLLWLAAAYGLGLLLLGRREKHPGLFAGTAAVSLLLVLGLSWWLPRQIDLGVKVPDTGSRWVILKNREQTFVVCSGGSPEKTARTLLGWGISRIDGLILPERSDFQAGEAFLARIPADRVYVPAGASEKAGVYPVDRPLTLSGEKAALEIFPGRKPGISTETSLNVLFRGETYDILIPGSGYEGRELPKVRCLIPRGGEIPPALLDRTAPDQVILTEVPDRETVMGMRDRGITLRKTWKEGTVTLRR